MTLPWFEVDWPAPHGVRALSTLRGDARSGASKAPYGCFNLGHHVGDDPAAVTENRRRLKVAAGLPSEPDWLSQVHGIRVAELDSPAAAGPADAAIARRSAKVCAILTADCLPILFASDSGDTVAAAHAGWRGLAAGVIEATVQAMGTLARRRLQRLGVSRIYGGGECTYTHADRYYSHRRDGITGRQATLIWREG